MRPLVFIHGWGMNSTVWQAVMAELSEYACYTIDLGFIKGGATTWQDLRPSAIYVGHSFGVLWALKQAGIVPEALVSIAGFHDFTSFTPKEALLKMQQGMKANPAGQMAHFWRQAGCKNFAKREALCSENLKQGLDWLASWQASVEVEALSCRKLILAALQDKIIPPAATEAQWPDDTIIWHDTAPHSLPLAEPQWVAAQIKAFLNR